MRLMIMILEYSIANTDPHYTKSNKKLPFLLLNYQILSVSKLSDMTSYLVKIFLSKLRRHFRIEILLITINEQTIIT